jgi:hypothetical protein
MREATYSIARDGGFQTQPLFWKKYKMTKAVQKTMNKFLRAAIALAAVSTAAQADALADLKSAIETLNKRDALSLVGDRFTVLPTADAGGGEAVDEPFTEVKISGYIKTGYIFSQIKDPIPLGANSDNSSDFDVEAGVNFRGSVQSSLGEVGATIQTKWDISESSNNSASTALRDEGIIGFWQFADTMKLEMGRGNAGRLENGITKNTRRIWTTADRRVRAENAGNGFFDRDAYNAFAGIAFASEPVTLTLRAHDATRGVSSPLGTDDDAIGFSAKGIYTSEMINLEAVGGYWGQSDAKNLPIASQTGVKWLAGAGTELSFIAGLPISIGAQTGRLHNGAKQINTSMSVGFTLTDEITAGLGAGWKKVSGAPNVTDNRTEKVLVGGIYYIPLSQLIIGLEGDWLDDGRPNATTNDGFTGALVARYSF